MKFTWKRVGILLIILYIGTCVFNFTNAQKSPNTTNLLESEQPDYRGLFDKGETPENYLMNGNFYSAGKPRKLGIDLSYIDKVDTAIWWYDKVIREFKGTEEANEAYRQKIRTLIGWTDGYGKDKREFGLHDYNKTRKYFPLIETTFLELEVGYPDDEYLEAFAFQIAQQYFYHLIVYQKNMKNNYKDDCIKWLEKTIALAEGKDTFYSHLAKLRLKMLQ